MARRSLAGPHEAAIAPGAASIVGRPAARSRGAARSGFTLVELAVVLAVLGILANLLIPAFLAQLQKARALELVSEYRAIRDAYLQYQADHGEAPRAWNRAQAHPDLEPYLADSAIRYRSPDGRFVKRITVFADSTIGNQDFKAALVLIDRDRTGILYRVAEVLEGQVLVYRPGRRIALVVE